jgi:hypothetical protein
LPKIIAKINIEIKKNFVKGIFAEIYSRRSETNESIAITIKAIKIDMKNTKQAILAVQKVFRHCLDTFWTFKSGEISLKIAFFARHAICLYRYTL